MLEERSVPAVAAADIQWIRDLILNSEGGGYHVVGIIRDNHTDNYSFDLNNDAVNYNGNEVRDSQAFTPWQEWGQ